jgi:hypothetical protein
MRFKVDENLPVEVRQGMIGLCPPNYQGVSPVMRPHKICLKAMPASVALLVMSLSLLSGCDNKVGHSANSKSANRETRLREELGKFVSVPDAERWNQLGLAATEAAGSDRAEFVLAIMRYHEARLGRDFPNSMSLVGMTPDQSVANHMKKLAAELGHLQLMASEPGAWDLLKALVLQRFDDQLRYSASEIASRTVPITYGQLLSELNVTPGDNLKTWETLGTLPN